MTTTTRGASYTLVCSVQVGIDRREERDLEKAAIPQVDLDHNVVDRREDELDLLRVW